MKPLITLTFIITVIALSCKQSDDIREINLSKAQNSENDSINTAYTDNMYVAVSTMISPLETFNLYRDLMDYISTKLNIPIKFKQRKTYAEVNELLKENKLDFAFICTGAYLDIRNKIPVELLVVPVVNGRPYYQAYIIVHEESKIREINKLKGKSFAFTDPLSNTGYLYMINQLKERGTSPEKFFKETFFTYAHDYSIQAVKKKITDGATVDGLVYDYLRHFQPEKVEGVKIINRSEEFGIPPFVVQKNLNHETKHKLREIMLTLHEDPEGKKLLSRIMIDKFIIGSDSLYK